MAITSTYPIIAPKAGDLIVGSQTYTVENPVLDNPTKNFTVGSVAALANAINLGYTSYAGYLVQSGTEAPLATVMQNTTGGTIAWSRNSAGNYSGTITGGAFTAGKTLVFVNQGGSTSASVNIAWASSATAINIITGADDVLAKASIEIRIYA